MYRFVSVAGIFGLLLIAWLLSEDKKRVPWRVIGWGIGLQVLFALFILKTPVGLAVFDATRLFVNRILDFTVAGASFVFGSLALNPNNPEHLRYGQPMGFFFFFGALPTIIFFASLMSILYHLGIMQKVVQGVAWVMVRTMGTSGAESLNAAANIFVGQTEAPLVVKPYLAQMTKSEIMAVMAAGFATIASGVFAVYASMGVDAGHLLAASVMSAPAALVMAKIMCPETEEPLTKGTVRLKVERTTVNIIDAAATGAADGMRLMLNVGAMLIAFLGLLAMVNYVLGALDRFVMQTLLQRPPIGLNLDMVLGWLFTPLAALLGFEWRDVPKMAAILGTQIAANEFVAYTKLVALKDVISPRSFTLATYALCGFANFGSIAIQLGGIGAMVPERRQDLAKLGLRAMVAGALGCYLVATIAGVLISDREAEWRYLVELRQRAERVQVLVQPRRIALKFAQSGDPEEQKVAREVLTKLRQRAEQLWRETDAKAKVLLTQGKRDEAFRLYDELARTIAFPEWAEKARQAAKAITHPNP
jgi:CNT family concentrative nucleoside transporter